MKDGSFDGVSVWIEGIKVEFLLRGFGGSFSRRGEQKMRTAIGNESQRPGVEECGECG